LVNNTHPDIEIVKTVRTGSSGAYSDLAKAHVGDTLEYRFEVHNTGNVQLYNVAVSDARCDAGTISSEPVGDTDGDGALDVSETWVFFCSHKLVAADVTDTFEFPNTATVTGDDQPEGGHEVSDDDDANAQILIPGVHVEKRVRAGDSGDFGETASVPVGDTANYQLAVTNTGNTPVALVVSDDRCDAPPAYQSGDADGDNLLDLTETWIYTCPHVVTAADGESFVNTATATGTDELGGKASDDDTATVEVPIAGALPETAVSPGVARLAGPGGCIGRSFSARVSGSKIARVVFTIDGRRVKTLRKPNKGKSFVLSVNPRKYRVGKHRLVAKVTFTAASKTRAKTMRLTFFRCSRKVAPPRFTG
jgi:uncharacterized repeat protein (TIGR01451 family)